MTEYNITEMVRVYETNRAKYAGGILTYACNQEAFEEGMRQALGLSKTEGGNDGQ